MKGVKASNRGNPRSEVVATERDILDIISSLISKKRELEESIHDRLAEVNRDLEASQRTLELLRELKGSTEGDHAPEAGIQASELRGMTQQNALRVIATYNGGILVVREARRLLIESGLAKGKHVSQSIYGLINRSGWFERLAAGRYRLRLEQVPQVQPNLEQIVQL
jgi:hypothetical protein